MDKEKRSLIMAAGDALKEKYHELAMKEKEKNNTIEALAHIRSEEAILKYQLAILTLDSQNKI